MNSLNVLGEIVKLKAIITRLLMAGSVVSAMACADGESASTTVGKVDRVYVCEARGLFMDKKLLKRTAGKEIWVDVRDATIAADHETGELFKVPAELAIERGDLVATQIGDQSVRDLNPNLIPTQNRVTQLIAPHDSLMAMMFGLSKASLLLSAFLGAKAN
jgi:hypothetical protein